MDWKKMTDAALIPIVALLTLQLFGFVALINPSIYNLSSSYYLLLPVGLLLFILPVFVYLYTGYSAVKKYHLKLEEAALTGALMAALMTLVNTLVTIQVMVVHGTYSEAFDTYAITLIYTLFGLITSSIFNGLLAFVGGLIAQWQLKKVEIKGVYILLAAVIAIILILAFLFFLFYLGVL